MGAGETLSAPLPPRAAQLNGAPGPHRRRLCSRNSAPSFVKRLSSRTPSARSLLVMRTSGEDRSCRPHCPTHMTQAAPMATKIG
jgi:hypothetical protein